MGWIKSDEGRKRRAAFDKEYREEMSKEELKPCPFCGQVPHMYGMRRRDYVNGEWAQLEGEEYWVKPFCSPWCYLGEVSARAFRITEGIHYKTPEAAAKAWNRRAKNDII